MLTTQLTLIRRLQNPDDREAWLLFVDIYYPAIFHSLRAKGLQHADAEDVSQQVLWSVSRSLAQRPYDPNRAKFRTWLETVIRNAAINALNRVPRDRGSGGDELLHEIPESTEGDEQLLLFEYRKQLFRVVAEQIRGEFSQETWQAFWRTSVLDESVDAVAKDLGKQAGSIYAARSRVIKRIRIEMESMREEGEG